jgi:hypothetical protein
VLGRRGKSLTPWLVRLTSRPTVFDLSNDKQTAHETTMKMSEQEGQKPYPIAGETACIGAGPHTKLSPSPSPLPSPSPSPSL